MVLKVVEINQVAGHRITRILAVLPIPRSTYYGYIHWQPSSTAIWRQGIKETVLEGWMANPMYGYPRLTILLARKWGIQVTPTLVYRCMCELGIQSTMRSKKPKPKPKSHTDQEQRPNLIRKRVDTSNVLLTDVTYIPVRNQWGYLASLYDPTPRRVVAHKAGANMTKELATSVIQGPLLRNLGTKIIHSDRGSQYTSDLFEHTLTACGVKHSYSRNGCPGDNARIESFHSILKREYVFSQFFQTLQEAIVGIDTYIRWYNEERISLVA